MGKKKINWETVLGFPRRQVFLLNEGKLFWRGDKKWWSIRSEEASHVWCFQTEGIQCPKRRVLLACTEKTALHGGQCSSWVSQKGYGGDEVNNTSAIWNALFLLWMRFFFFKQRRWFNLTFKRLILAAVLRSNYRRTMAETGTKSYYRCYQNC